MSSKETPSGSCEKTGGGEWTALRELKAKWLELADSAECYAEEAKRHSYPPEKIESHARTARTLKKCAADLEALAAAAPAPATVEPLCTYCGHGRNSHSEEMPYDCHYGCGCEEFSYVDGMRKAAVSPQDGQGAELHPTGAITVNAITGPNGPFNLLPVTDAEREAYEKETAALGPPRGGSSSDLAEPKNLNVGDEVWVRATVTRFIERENNGVEIRLEFRENGMIRTWCNASDLRSLPEAVAGNASAPVGERRETSGVQQSSDSVTARAYEVFGLTMREKLGKREPSMNAWAEQARLVDETYRELMKSLPAGQPSGVGEPRQWLIYFADVDHDSELFVGPLAEQAARARSKEASANWDCTLFCTAVAAREVGEGLREALDEMRKEAKQLIDRSEVLANNGEAHRSDLSLARGREIEGVVARLAALAAPAPKPFANQFIVTKSIAEDDHTIKYFDPAGKQIFISDAPAPKPAPPLSEEDVIAVLHDRATCKCQQTQQCALKQDTFVRRAAERKPPR